MSKPPSERIPTSAELPPIRDEESEPENSFPNGVDVEPFENHETSGKYDVNTVIDVETIAEQNSGTLPASAGETNGDVECTNEQIINCLVLPSVTKALVLSFTD